MRSTLDRIQHERRNRSERHRAASRRQRIGHARQSSPPMIGSDEAAVQSSRRGRSLARSAPSRAGHGRGAWSAIERRQSRDLVSGNSTAADTMARRATPRRGHCVHRGARTIGDERARAERFARMRADRRQHRVVPAECGRDRVRSARITRHDRDRPGCRATAGKSEAELFRRPNERGDLVAVLAREVEDLRASSSVRANDKQSHISKTGQPHRL